MTQLQSLFLTLRPRHWSKNLFVFLPLVFGEKLFDGEAALRTLGAFVLFSLCSSAVYVLNDILDAPHDRLHRTKRFRPIAAGRLDPAVAGAAAAALSVASLAASPMVDPRLAGVLALYVAANVVYTLFLKKIVILDVFCLGLFFVLRVAAGTFSADVRFSHWMLYMVMLLAFFLGFAKRRQELVGARGDASDQRWVLSKYSRYFLDQVMAVLTASIVVVYMLYTIDRRTVEQFGTERLYFTSPFVYYGIFRYLYLIHKRRKGEDPTAVLFSDRMTLVNLLLWMGACIVIIYFKP